jgi:hypothetical protein
MIAITGTRRLVKKEPGRDIGPTTTAPDVFATISTKKEYRTRK